MTRRGTKRAYLEAGFGSPQPSHAAAVEDWPTSNNPSSSKKRNHGTGELSTPAQGEEVSQTGVKERTLVAETLGKGSKPRDDPAKKRSEIRRLKRIADRYANTICYACRGYGHAAKDCPREGTTSTSSAKGLVGICYRCGSKKHTLSRCPKAPDADNSLPFASCFVCSSMGHLASSCPQNSGKGIYPNGGCCKLCGDTSHLARNCELRTKASSVADTHKVMGIAQGEAGADEDDFHMFRRRNTEIEKAEKGAVKVEKLRQDHTKNVSEKPATARRAKVVHF